MGLKIEMGAGEVSCAKLVVMNKCRYTVWPGIQPSAGKEILARGGFQLLPNKFYILNLPTGWSGRLWGRHGCHFDANGHGTCATGDCGGTLYCAGAGGAPPATLAEITLGQDQVFYSFKSFVIYSWISSSCQLIYVDIFNTE